MKDRLLPIGFVLLLVVLGGWLASNLEWVDKEVDTPMHGEAATNPLYATHHLVERLGGKVVRPRDGLSELPPTGSTLYLSSNEWSLFPGRVEALQRWVDQGGHLVVASDLVTQSGLSEWVPVTQEIVKSRPHHKDDEDDDNAAARNDSRKSNNGKPKDDCVTLRERATPKPRYPGKNQFKACVLTRRTVHSNNPLLWSVMGPNGPVIVRVKAGAGTITVHSLPMLFDNREVARADHPLLLAATLQAAPGREVWFLHDEKRAPFTVWLWDNAWVVVLTALLAIAAGLWRGLPRFGPRIAPMAPLRRSMGEQISGTAQFLRRHGPRALHAAARRALDETAHKHVRHYANLPVGERARILAALTSVPEASLAQALQPDPPNLQAGLSTLVHCLETARRRLRNSAEQGSLSPAAHDAGLMKTSEEGKENADPT